MIFLNTSTTLSLIDLALVIVFLVFDFTFLAVAFAFSTFSSTASGIKSLSSSLIAHDEDKPIDYEDIMPAFSDDAGPRESNINEYDLYKELEKIKNKISK